MCAGRWMLVLSQAGIEQELEECTGGGSSRAPARSVVMVRKSLVFIEGGGRARTETLGITTGSARDMTASRPVSAR